MGGVGVPRPSPPTGVADELRLGGILFRRPDPFLDRGRAKSGCGPRPCVVVPGLSRNGEFRGSRTPLAVAPKFQGPGLLSATNPGQVTLMRPKPARE